MLQPGDRIGDWLVERQLGEGGMGAVFVCRNAISPRIRAAVKVMKPDAAGGRDRFVREVEALDGLRHNAVVRVKGWGEDAARGVLFLAMELVEGEDLETRLNRGALPVAQACRLILDVAGGLVHAHDLGIAHRDIKPSNIMICEDGSGRLVDFGIAVDQGKTRMTATGIVSGTLSYLAPECFSTDDPDPKLGDVYALGLVLYEALTGTKAFSLDSSMSGPQQLARMFTAKQGGAVFDPGPGFSASLRSVVTGATAPDARKRTRRIVDFEASLRDALAEHSAEPGDTTWERRPASGADGQAERPAGRVALGIGVVVAALVAAILGGIAGDAVLLASGTVLGIVELILVFLAAGTCAFVSVLVVGILLTVFARRLRGPAVTAPSPGRSPAGSPR